MVTMPSQKPEYERSNSIATVVLAVCSVLSLAIVVFSKESALPSWFNYIVFFLAAFGIVLFLVRPVRKIRVRMKNDSIAGSRLPQLVRLIEDFRELTNHDHSHSIVHALGNLQNQEQGWFGSGIQNLQFSQVCNRFAQSLIQSAQQSGQPYGRFQLTTNDLCAIVQSFNYLYFCDVFRKLQQKDIAIVQDYHKKSIESAREKFVAYLGRVEDFCKDTNQALGTIVFQFTPERPKALE